jgi:Leucine-rich repeat (LRR) protein
MTEPLPPLPRHTALLDRLTRIGRRLDGVRDALRQVNDPDLQTRAQTLLRTGSHLLTAHHPQPGPDLARALAGFRTGIRELHAPLEDPELGELPSLDALAGSVGLLVMAVDDALDAARALGLSAGELTLPQDLVAEVPRAGNDDLLRAIAARLDAVGRQVDRLDAARAEPTGFVQQTGLLNLYVPAMRVELDLARLHLSVGGVTVDFSGLARAAEAMTELTGDLLATVRGWMDRVSAPVRQAAEAVNGGVRKVRVAVRAATRMVRWRRGGGGAPVPPVPAPGSSPFPFEGFSPEAVRDLILAGKEVPDEWVPLVTKLDFSGTKLADLGPLAKLTALHTLHLGRALTPDGRRLTDPLPITDVAPLAGLTALQHLYLDGTQVSDVTPLAGLTALQHLSLFDTQVSDVAPLAELTALQYLALFGTGVSDVAPLAGLTALRRLDLGRTRVSNVAPLAGLTALQHLDLSGTGMSDVAPLAGLTALQHLSLSRTQVSDVAPLAGLTALQHLYLGGTQVSDVAPLAGLTALQHLSLGRTRVSNVAPLAGLTALQHLWLNSTDLRDVAPLAGLTALQHLDLRGAQVSDVAPLAGLTALQHLDLRGAQVSDVAPLAGLTALQHLDLRGTPVRDVAPLAVVDALRTLRLPDDFAGDLSAFEHRDQLEILGGQVARRRPAGRG